MIRSPLRRTPFARRPLASMKRVPLKAMSAKRRAYLVSSGYSARSAAARQQQCAVGSPVCWGRADGLHHILPRGANGGLEAAERDGPPAVPCCSPCNSYVSEHAAWARAAGWLLRRSDAAVAA